MKVVLSMQTPQGGRLYGYYSFNKWQFTDNKLSNKVMVFNNLYFVQYLCDLLNYNSFKVPHYYYEPYILELNRAAKHQDFNKNYIYK